MAKKKMQRKKKGDKTIAEIANKIRKDKEKHQKRLEKKPSSKIARNTSKLMVDKSDKKLEDLYLMQESKKLEKVAKGEMSPEEFADGGQIGSAIGGVLGAAAGMLIPGAQPFLPALSSAGSKLGGMAGDAIEGEEGAMAGQTQPVQTQPVQRYAPTQPGYIPTFANGGMTPNGALPGNKMLLNTVELEEEEVYETPGGRVEKVDMPSHENATEENLITLPTGTKVYSDDLTLDKETAKTFQKGGKVSYPAKKYQYGGLNLTQEQRTLGSEDIADTNVPLDKRTLGQYNPANAAVPLGDRTLDSGLDFSQPSQNVTPTPQGTQQEIQNTQSDIWGTAYKAAPFISPAVNLARGLFEDIDLYDPQDYMVDTRVEPYKTDISPQIRSLEGREATQQRNIRRLSPAQQLAGQTQIGTAASQRESAIRNRAQQIDARNKMMADRINLRTDMSNAQKKLMIDKLNRQTQAQKENLLLSGAEGVSKGIQDVYTNQMKLNSLNSLFPNFEIRNGKWVYKDSGKPLNETDMQRVQTESYKIS